MEVRGAKPDDYDAYARLMPELGVDDPLPTREKFAAEMCARALVAAHDGAIVGYALFEVLADVGYVRNVVSDPARRRQGIGAALMEAMRQRFVAAGARSWCLNVKPDNAAAIALYRRFGFEPAYLTYAMRMPRSAPAIAAAGDLDIALTPIAPEEDAEVEAATGLLPGQLASSRARKGRLLLQLRRRDAIAGVAVFDPAFPGAFPFRVAEPELGPPLLEALRALAPAGSAYVQVVVEDDDALRDVLSTVGAQVHLEILHMRGPLSR
jgi:GNAT superfamily N-acetyltransferase